MSMNHATALHAEICARMGVDPASVPVPASHSTAAAGATTLPADLAARVATLMGVDLAQVSSQQVSPLASQIQALTAQVQGLVQAQASRPEPAADARRAEVFHLMGVDTNHKPGA